MKSFLFVILITLGLMAVRAQEIAACDDDNCVSSHVYGLTAAEIDAVEVPELESLTPNHDLMHDRWYKQVLDATPVYNAPGGQIVRTIDPGFNFVTALRQENGWTQINADEWVQSDKLQDVSSTVSSFTGFLLPDEISDITIAWALVNMFPSRVPGGNPSETFNLIYRYTPLFIYDTVDVDGYRWYQIAADQWVHQHRIAKILPLAEKPADVTTQRWISIDLYEQVLIAYEGNMPVFATLISSGLDRWPTREGTYHIYYRMQRDHMTWGTVGDDYYFLEEVPWTMYFDEGRALHGAYWHDGFGYRRSHGCVNLSITDAKWLFDWVAAYMGTAHSADREEGPMVRVYYSDSYD